MLNRVTEVKAGDFSSIRVFQFLRFLQEARPELTVKNIRASSYLAVTCLILAIPVSHSPTAGLSKQSFYSSL